MDTLAAVTALFFAAALTPGPNNFLVMAAGARGGYSNAAPVIAGVVLGGWALLALSWCGVAGLLADDPELRLGATLVGAGYLAWMGLRLAVRGSSAHEGSRALASTWSGVACFQFLNPKAWVLFLTATAVMSRDFEGSRGFLLLALVYGLRSLVTLSAWALAGSVLLRLFEGRRLECAMGGLLVAMAAGFVFGAT